jgi:hypothetical protein
MAAATSAHERVVWYITGYYLRRSSRLWSDPSLHIHAGSWRVAFVHATRSSPARSRQHGRSCGARRMCERPKHPKGGMRYASGECEERARRLSITTGKKRSDESACVNDALCCSSGWFGWSGLPIHERAKALVVGPLSLSTSSRQDEDVGVKTPLLPS